MRSILAFLYSSGSDYFYLFQDNIFVNLTQSFLKDGLLSKEELSQIFDNIASALIIKNDPQTLFDQKYFQAGHYLANLTSRYREYSYMTSSMYFSEGFVELVLKNLSSMQQSKPPSSYYQSESFNITSLNLAFKELSSLTLDSSNVTDNNILKVGLLNLIKP